jgi:hypothetical protein
MGETLAGPQGQELPAKAEETRVTEQWRRRQDKERKGQSRQKDVPGHRKQKGRAGHPRGRTSEPCGSAPPLLGAGGLSHPQSLPPGQTLGLSPHPWPPGHSQSSWLVSRTEQCAECCWGTLSRCRAGLVLVTHLSPSTHRPQLAQTLGLGHSWLSHLQPSALHPLWSWPHRLFPGPHGNKDNP